jgi:hypothetical protein
MKSRLLTSAAVISASQVSSFLPLQILSIKKACFASKTPKPKNHSVVVKPSARYLKSITKSALTKKLVDALEAYKLIYNNTDVKARFASRIKLSLRKIVLMRSYISDRNDTCAPITKQILTNSVFYLSSFIVPTGDNGAIIDSRWPEHTRGFRLGTRIVGEILIARSFLHIFVDWIAKFLHIRWLLWKSELRAEHRNANLRPTKGDSKAVDDLLDKLENLGFIFCRREQQIKLLRLALTSYKSIYSDLNIPKVPCYSTLLTLTMWYSSYISRYYALGQCVWLMLFVVTLLSYNELSMDAQITNFSALILFVCLFFLFSVCLFVQFFVCPTDDPMWPEETWGMKLGFTVGNIRNKGSWLLDDCRF